MFKNVEYAGFNDHPDLRVLADRVMAALASIVGEWDKHIDVELEAYSDRPAGIELSVSLNLPTARGKASRFLTRDELQNPDALEDRCRSVWLRAMDSYIDRRKPVWDEIVNQPAEV